MTLPRAYEETMQAELDAEFPEEAARALAVATPYLLDRGDFSVCDICRREFDHHNHRAVASAHIVCHLEGWDR